MEVSKDVLDKIYEAIELARSTGKIKKGINEVTKAVERGIAKLVLLASDVNPAEIIMHIEPLCKEKSIPVVKVKSREELGALSGLQRPTTTIAIIQEGEAKNILKDVISKLGKKKMKDQKSRGLYFQMHTLLLLRRLSAEQEQGGR